MKTEVRALVIGGGVVGCSILYHLAKLGWRDIALLDKNELTSGSTWHAAGGMHTFNGDANVSKLQKYTIDLYRELEALTDMHYSLIGERRRHSPPGANGGEPGKPGRNLVDGEEVPGKATGSLRAGQRLRIETPGGGGHG